MIERIIFLRMIRAIITYVIESCFYFTTSFPKDSSNRLEIADSGLGGTGEDDVVQAFNVNASTESAITGNNNCIVFIFGNLPN